MEINEIVSAIESLTLIQASELVKALEEKFGVSAAAPVAAAGVAGAPAAAAEEKTEFDVVLASFDAAKKVAIIKAVREVVPGLGLKEAKDIVEGAPKTLKEGASKKRARRSKSSNFPFPEIQPPAVGRGFFFLARPREENGPKDLT